MTDAPIAHVALVTGGARGIGFACARELIDHGWTAVIADRDEEALRLAQKQLGVDGIVLDVTDRDAVDRGVRDIVERLGPIGLLVNNAGIANHAPLAEVGPDDWSAVIDVNLRGVFHCLQSVGRHMLQCGTGAIVNIASVAAVRGVPERGSYAVAKAGVVALTQTAAVEWATRGVRVNAVGPGYVETDLISGLVEQGVLDLKPVLARTPMGRLADPREIARAVRFLGSPDASYITGQVLYVDGGFLADYGVPSTRGLAAAAPR